MVTERKRKTVETFEELISGNEVVGVLDMEGIPAAQLQQIKADLRPDATVKMGKNTLIRMALGNQGLDGLNEYVERQTALIFTDMNPFKLHSRLQEGRTKAPASSGDVAPNDIEVEEGDTGLPPGPVVGDLQQAGIPASIEGGSVVVNNATTVAEAGETISAELADALGKLDIKPIEIGLSLRSVYEDGSVLEPDVLDIDVESYRSDVEQAAAGARNLAVNAGIPTEESLPAMLSKARGEALHLALEAGFKSEETIEDLVSQAEARAYGLASELGDEFVDEEMAQEQESSEAQGGEEAAEEEEKEEDTEEADEDEAEDDAAEGLGNMFG